MLKFLFILKYKIESLNYLFYYSKLSQKEMVVYSQGCENFSTEYLSDTTCTWTETEFSHYFAFHIEVNVCG